MRTLIAIVTSCLISVAALAQDYESMPGYVDFGTMNEIYGEPRVMINIGGPLMQLLSAAAAASKDPEAAAIMQGLEGIRVNVYDTGGNLAPALERMNQAKTILQAANWQPIVQVQEADEQVQMFTRVNADNMEGMAIMVVNQEEAVFLNILGNIDPAQVSKVMEQINVDVDVDTE
ncbi:hypothetical protein BST95_07200 [Halioglobus japonicus]|uniref:DUF4252 domain-containing protein n=1 Tax=Halioglobus japonicus TaxID=930805 RepID=A0AAP8MDX6_9GAMM|nr:DUF4252 domain-containing protein [Halioglobus japonicus]AQA18060.1 hypothetical protein BST95_07200 [Halioglobus japonicus]PLW86051.1 DUF4252 domain-containing protein [Halioglobus japonicus]GHD14737.1 hypothetical protein GCM10007052_18820 [Halioglobus japonicus]